MPKSRISTLTGRSRRFKPSSGLPSNFRLFNFAKVLTRLSTPTGFRSLSLTGIISAVLLLALPALLTLVPALTIPGVSATEDFGLTDISVRGVASIAATDTVSMDLTPRANEPTFTTGYGQVTVTSNTKNGYYVYISTEDSSLTYSGHESAQNVNTISSATSTGTAMSAPSWGYVVGTKCGQSGATNCVSQTQNNAADLALTYNKVPGAEGAALVNRSKGDPEANAKGETIYVGYGFKAAANQSVGVYSRKVTYTGLAKKARGTLVVNPNGGSWAHNGAAASTSEQSFTEEEGTEMTIEAPASNAYYTISYNANSQGATYSATDANTKATRSFQGWNVTAAASGAAAGSYNSSTKVYTFAEGSDMATASYASTSSSFTLPTITKSGYSCQWAKDSASGTKFDGNASQTATANTTYYAVCTQNTSGTVSFSGSNVTFNPTSLTGIPSNNGTKTVTITPASGFYIATALSCTGNFTASSMSTGTGATGAQTVTITYTGATSGATSTCSLTTGSLKSYMQGWTGCSGLAEGGTATLYDKRDEQAYTVTKINHSASASLCWMTQNLRIGGATAMTLSKDLTDSSSDYPLPASTTAGFNDDNGAFVYIDSTHGGYYSWKAATAGTSPSSGEASASICPKGWRLPTKSEFDTLKSYKGWSNSSGWTSGIFKGQLAGRYDYGSPGSVGSSGNYWSSTAFSSTGAYSLIYNSSGAGTNNLSKRRGYSVRCVSRS